MKLRSLREVFPIIFITMVVFISVALLTWTDSVTAAKIEEQKDHEIQNMLQETFPNMDDYIFEDDIYTIYTDGAKIGYAFMAVGKGYGGNIDILVGLEDEATIKGITIISQSETPGLGSRIAESSFADKFTGLVISDIILKQDGGQMDALTGATISSQAVVDAVRTTAMEKIKSLKEKE